MTNAEPEDIIWLGIHSRRTQIIAEMLSELDVAVSYPGLPSHPGHKLFASMINEESYGFGGLITIDCKTVEKANQLMSSLQNKENFGYIAVSLGY